MAGLASSALGGSTNMQTATFAAGWFFGVWRELSDRLKAWIPFGRLYRGTTINPTYAQVCTHLTGHAEAVEVVFDSSKVFVTTTC